MTRVDIAIVGGGPAGISAAVAAVDRGLKVALIEENRTPGGKVLRSGFDPQHGPPADPIESRLGRRLAAAFNRRAPRIDWYPEREVWNIDGARVVEFCPVGGAASNGNVTPDGNPCGNERLQAAAIVLATGAIERVLPFPGWTLPGVFSVGGLNEFVKQDILPGRRFVVAGSGPLLLVLVHNLIRAGAEIAAVVNATDWRCLVDHGPRLISSAGLLKLTQGIWIGLRLKHYGAPVHMGRVVAAARGIDRVTSVTTARVDRSWHPHTTGGREIAADAVAVGYGLIPAIEAARACGCKNEFDPQKGYWRINRDKILQTSVPGVFAAGDGGVISGYDAAIDEGRAAGIAAALFLGHGNRVRDRQTLDGLARRRHRIQRFADTMADLARPRSGYWELLTPDTILCRCEAVTVEQVQRAVAAGACDVNDIKRRTRCGMGPCQGRLCGQNLNELIRHLAGRKVPRTRFSSRVPLRPIALEAIAS